MRNDLARTSCGIWSRWALPGNARRARGPAGGWIACVGRGASGQPERPELIELVGELVSRDDAALRVVQARAVSAGSTDVVTRVSSCN